MVALLTMLRQQMAATHGTGRPAGDPPTELADLEAGLAAGSAGRSTSPPPGIATRSHSPAASTATSTRSLSLDARNAIQQANALETIAHYAALGSRGRKAKAKTELPKLLTDLTESAGEVSGGETTRQAWKDFERDLGSVIGTRAVQRMGCTAAKEWCENADHFKENQEENIRKAYNHIHDPRAKLSANDTAERSAENARHRHPLTPTVAKLTMASLLMIGSGVGGYFLLGVGGNSNGSSNDWTGGDGSSGTDNPFPIPTQPPEIPPYGYPQSGNCSDRYLCIPASTTAHLNTASVSGLTASHPTTTEPVPVTVTDLPSSIWSKIQ